MTGKTHPTSMVDVLESLLPHLEENSRDSLNHLIVYLRAGGSLLSIGGDMVGGDKITVGDITSSIVAINSQISIGGLTTEDRALLEDLRSWLTAGRYPFRGQTLEYDVFLSYAWADDKDFVQKLYRDLTDQGLRVFHDEEELRSDGDRFRAFLRDKLVRSARVAVIIGPEATRKSTILDSNIALEWNTARDECKPIIPILRLGDEMLIPEDWRDLLYRDFRQSADYPKMLTHLLADLRRPITPPAKLSGTLPSLPPNYLARPDDLREIAQLVLQVDAPPVMSLNHQVQARTERHGTSITAVRGMGGVGKSVLVNALARSSQIRLAFPDGIIWVTIGQQPGNLASKMKIIADALGTGGDYKDEESGKVLLGEALRERLCLILLDDIWDAAHAEPFLAALDQSHSRLLLTTRDGELATTLGASEYRVDVLSEPAALALLAGCGGFEVRNLPADAHKVARECGYLPLTLTVCGAMAKNGADWARILRYLQDADLTEISARLPEYRNYPTVYRAIRASVDMLRDQLIDQYEDEGRAEACIGHYHQLGIFKEDAMIPEDAIVSFWVSINGISTDTAHGLIGKLASKELLRVEGWEPHRRIWLHDLQHDYLRAALKDLGSLHGKLLVAYNPSNAPWHTIPDDGYLYEHLVHHLLNAGQYTEAYRLLVGSRAWMDVKFASKAEHGSFVADLQLALTSLTDPLKPEDVVMVAQLWTARQVISAQVELYEDIDLQTLVRLGQERRAISHARLRSLGDRRCQGLLAVYEALADLGKRDRELIEEITEMAISLPSSQIRRNVLTQVALELVELGDVSQALDVVSNNAADLRNYALVEITRALAQGDQLEQALEVANSITRNSPRLEALLSVADAYIRTNETNRAFPLVQQALELADDEFELSAVLIRLVMAHEGNRALKVAEGITDSLSLVRVALSIAAWGSKDLAAKILSLAQKRTAPQRSIFKLVSGSRIDGNIKWEQKLGNRNPDEEMQREIEVALLHQQLGDKAVANKLFEDFIHRVNEIGGDTRVLEELTTLAVELDRVEHLMAVVPKENRLSILYQIKEAATICAQRGDYEQALRLVDQLDDQRWRAGAFTGILETLVDNHDQRAREVLGSALQAIAAIEDPATKAMLLCGIGEILVQANDPQSRQILDMALAATYQSEFYSTEVSSPLLSSDLGVIRYWRQIDQVKKIANLYAILGDNRAEGLLTSTLIIAPEMEQFRDSVKALRAVGRLLTECDLEIAAIPLNMAVEAGGDWLDGGDLYDLVREIAAAGAAQLAWEVTDQYLPNLPGVDFPSARSEYLRSIAIELANAGLPDESLKTVDLIDPHGNGLREQVLQRSATALVKKGQINRVLELVKEIPESEREWTCRAIVGFLISEKRPSDALMMITGLNEALSYDPRLLSEIAEEYAHIGDIAQALKVSEAIKNDGYRNWSLRQAALECTRNGEITQALEISDSINDKQDRNLTLQQIAITLVENGHEETALKVIDAIDLTWARADTLYQCCSVLTENKGPWIDKFTDDGVFAARRVINEKDRIEALQKMSNLLLGIADSRASALIEEALQGAQALGENDLLVEVATTLIKAKDPRGKEILQGVLKEADRISDIRSRNNLLDKVAELLCQSEDNAISPLLNLLVDEARKLEDPHRRDAILPKAANSFARIGRLKEALNLIDTIQTYDERRDALRGIVMRLAHFGDVQVAVNAAQRIENTEDCIDLLVKLIESLALTKDPHLDNTLDAAIGKVEQMEFYDRAKKIGEIATALGRADDVTRALKVIALVTDEEERVSTLGDLLVTFLEKGSISADQIMREVFRIGSTMPRSRQDVTRLVGLKLARRGYFSRAFDMLGSRELPEFIEIVASWDNAFEQAKPQLSYDVINECVRVAGWVSPTWQAVHTAIHQPLEQARSQATKD